MRVLLALHRHIHTEKTGERKSNLSKLLLADLQVENDKHCQQLLRERVNTKYFHKIVFVEGIFWGGET